MMDFIVVKTEYLDQLCEITEQAKAQLKKLGVDQWQKGYPNKEVWESDIKEGCSWIAVENGCVLGAFMLLTVDEPSYYKIDGKWLTDLPYASLHRVCVSDAAKGTGVAGKLFEHGCKLAKEKGFSSIRIDTHPKNKPMLRAIEKFGFIKCGNIIIKGGSEDGDPRFAFEKII